MKLRPWAVSAFAMLVLAGGASLSAQSAPEFTVTGPPVPLASPQTTGFPVTGRVVCSDTQRAARFATVLLIGAQQEGPGGRRLFTRTDLDGNFTLNNVPAGDYYVTASLIGYINTANQVQSALSAGTDPGAVQGASLVHVSAGGATAAISLQRGAVLTGAVQWDDGSPAAGISVSAQVASSATTSGTATEGRITGAFGGGFNGTQTDDRGHFRLSGLPAGPYYLRANIQAAAPQGPSDRGSGRTLSLAVYAPNKVRRSEAMVLTLAAAEERSDVNVVLGLAGMHSVSGVLGSSGVAVRSGTVNLSDQTDSTLSRSGGINPDGSFVVPYVPPGTYTLRVTASSQANSFGRGGGQSSEPATRFQPFQESITVADSDLTGVNATLTPATTSP